SNHAAQLGNKRHESNKILVNIINESKGCCIEVDAFEEIRNNFIPEFNGLELIPYVKEFVESLHKTRTATNSSRNEVEKKTKVKRFFFCSNNVEVIKIDNKNKYGAVLKCMSLTLEECLVFEDSLHGVYQALSQNMKVIWVQDERMKEYFESYNDLYENSDVHIFSSFNDNHLEVDQ
ncbi:33283_t:CDS:2, partial [Gigaspora margarita]